MPLKNVGSCQQGAKAKTLRQTLSDGQAEPPALLAVRRSATALQRMGIQVLKNGTLICFNSNSGVSWQNFWTSQDEFRSSTLGQEEAWASCLAKFLAALDMEKLTEASKLQRTKKNHGVPDFSGFSARFRLKEPWVFP